ncbi:hypothetical protein N657DRAFT_694102 [Parathielavia appendiculata]|uniref:Uncharacterized protein n=1 Tax=Parathielavia appendiculata TaxID=2587402 RepID=A0AAN6TQL0_9PEZI|nr:hypothetical protein N657DRAFT_694102 [Parathielavia appendiculata]
MSLSRVFECSVPGCGRRFTRKEHLTRHIKCHGAQPQHQCPICGRRYMRSDVLKRHIDFHPQQSRRTKAACVSCHRQKRKCGGDAPCQPCLSNGIACVRPATSAGSNAGGTPTTGDTNYGEDMLGSAWSEGQHHWPLSASSLPPDPVSRLQSPSQALAEWTLLADTPTPPSPAPRTLPGEASTIAADEETPLSPTREGAYSNQALHALVRQDVPNSRHLVQIYFAEIHPYWPILHVPTFELENASDLLLGAMLMLSRWIAGREDHVQMASVVLEEVIAATSLDSTPSLHTLQALLLCVIYAICCRGERGMLARAVRLNTILVSTCRCLEVFHGRHTLPERLEECAFTFWLAEEQLHRLAFSVLRIDTYLSVLLDHPPSVRYQEFCIPLPKSSQLWASPSDEERRRLQWDEPAGRGRALFGYLMRDALADTGSDAASELSQLLPYRLNRMDYHLGLCALQTGVWEAAREAHSAASDDIVTKLLPGAPIDLWRAHLRRWCTKMVQDGGHPNDWNLTTTTATTTAASSSQAIITGASDMDSAFTPLTLTLWHMSVIKMHAPLIVLRGIIYGHFAHHHGTNAAAAAAMTATQKPRARLRKWMPSPCARTAVYSASQIARLLRFASGATAEAEAHAVNNQLFPPLAHEFTSTSTSSTCSLRHLLLSNPLAIPGLLVSAIVVCSYASQTSACPDCLPASGGSDPAAAAVGAAAQAAAVDLFTAGINDADLTRWTERGEGWAVWGGGQSERARIPICRCRLTELGVWFKRALPHGDYDALRELEVFLGGLNA